MACGAGLLRRCRRPSKRAPIACIGFDWEYRTMKIEHVSEETPEERLYLKALAVRYEQGRGLWLPIMCRLALRGHTGAMIELADWLSKDDSAKRFGKVAHTFSAAGLYYRACRKGDARAAHNAAMSCFNRNDMIGYRQWLGRAAKAGDADARRELRHFETRLWHSSARRVGRLRPLNKREKFANYPPRQG